MGLALNVLHGPTAKESGTLELPVAIPQKQLVLPKNGRFQAY
jgi:hypothetical protein